MTGLTMRRLSTALAAAFLLAALPAISTAAVPARRVSHTSTLLTNGNILIAGGVDETNASLNTAELFLASKANSIVATGNIDAAVFRASHTATLLSNGCVLVAGGNVAANSGPAAPVPTATARLYDPETGTWAAAAAMNTPRYNHTATLLNDGRVLVCGGQNAAGAALPGVAPGSGSCEFYTPGANCTAAGSFAAAPDMLQARYNHTATLLKDGRVWFAGGRNPAIGATGGYLVTTERFDPLANAGAGAFQSASPLIEARAHHTATLMGDGKALVVGGYNNREVLANYGMTESAEIYDPVSNSVTPAAVMSARRMAHASVLSANGQVTAFGGLGNITTTYINPSTQFKAGSIISFNAPAAPFASINGTTGLIPISFPLSTQVSGEIVDGEIWMSSPSVHPAWGMINFTSATPYALTAGGVGLRISMNGMESGCLPDGSKCGIIDVNPASLSQMVGQVIFYRRKDVQNSDSAATSGTINFAPATIDTTTPNGVLTGGGSFTTTLTLGMDNGLIGSNLKTGTLTFKAGTIIRGSGFTVTLTGATGGVIAGTFPIGADTNGAGTVNVTVTFSNLVGDIKYDANSGSLNTGAALGAADKINVTSDMIYTTDGADLNTESFHVDVATVVIRSMIYSDAETYNPKTNSWVLAPPPGSSPSDHRFGHSATLLPNNDTVVIGGRGCSGATCATRVATPSIGFQLLFSEANFASTLGSAAQKRAFHTSTLLPSGNILVAGGTNGPSILSSAEIFSPDTGLFTPVNGGGMRYVRDLHTATLMPNGRVLIAGGFTTNAASTGSTNTAEIYYPDTNRFIETSPMISSRSNHSAIMLPDGRIFVAGGFGTGDVITGNAEIFLSTANRWMSVAAMPAGCERAIHATVQLKDGRIMLIGGVNASGPLDTTAVYNPGANTWDCASTALIGAPGLTTPLRSHTATLLFDGRVLVAGGNDGLGEANKSFIYDPLLNTWSATHATPLLQPRFNHTATLLPNGTVMITGGSQKFGNIPTPIETFHINASSWVAGAVAFSNGPRAFHTMTLGLNNRLYGIGGSDGVVGGVGSTLYTKAESGYFTATPDAFSKDSATSFRQSTITATSPAALSPNTTLTVTGSQFRGGTEAAGGGAASANSSFSFPHLVLQQVDGSGGAASQSNGGFVVDLTTVIFTNPANLATLDTSLTVFLPPTSSSMPYGWYTLRTGANDIYSNGKMVQVGPTKPTLAPANLTGVAAGVSSMTWSWDVIPGVDGYNVYNATTGIFISTITIDPLALALRATFYQTGLDPSATTSILVAGYKLLGDGPLTAGPTVYTISTCPINVTIASVTFSDLLLYWGSNGNSSPGTVYEVTQSSDNFITDVSTPLPREFGQTGFFTTITNLTANTTYFFRVQAFNLVGLPSTYSAVKSTQTRAGVTQPIVSARTTSTLDWTWTPASGVTNYRVYNATNSVLLATPVAPSFTEVGMGTNTEHSIRVSAVTAAGEGPLSPSASAYTAASSPGVFIPRISQLTTGSFLLNWTNNANPPQTLYRALVTEFDVHGASVTTTTMTVSGLPLSQGFGGLIPSTRYGYELVAINGDGIDSDTPAAIVGSTWTLPTAPASLAAVGTTPTSIDITWLKNNNSSSATYEVTYTTDNFVTNISTAISFAAQFGGSASTLTLTVPATITGLVTGSSYSVRVVASNPFGQLSQFSNIITTRTSNGGGVLGSLTGPILAANNSALVGSLGNGRQVSLRVPAHAFPGDVTIAISSWSIANHGGDLDCSGGLTDIGFEITDAPALQPTGSLFLGFDFLPAQLGTIPAGRALLMRYDPGSRTCVPLETTVDTATGMMTARINHFSRFQVGQLPLSTTAETARLYPNPFYAGRDGFVTIDNLPASARVRIFTLRGEQVLDVLANSNGVMTWSGTNGSGRKVASGVYLMIIESGGTKKIMKLAVIR